MPTGLPGRRAPTTTLPDEGLPPYLALIAAVMSRALADARGDTLAPGTQTPGEVRREARAWLRDTPAVTALVELTGIDVDAVLRRVQQVLAATAPRYRAAQHRALFGDRP